MIRLGNILRADFARSEAALALPALRASFGPAHHAMFDFEAMSRLLSHNGPRGGLSERRRQRVQEALVALRTQRFFPHAGDDAAYRFEFATVDSALAAFREAHARSTLLHQREPSNGQRLFDLAQAEYWIGFVALEQGRLDDAGTWFRRYRDSGQQLAALDLGNFAWQRELSYGYHNLAVLEDARGRYAEAEEQMLAELELYRAWVAQRPDDRLLRSEMSDVASRGSAA